MPLQRGHSRRHLVESDVENRYDPQDLKIQNLHRQVGTLFQRLDQIEPRDQLFDESTYEGDDNYLVYGDGPVDDVDFEDLIYNDELDEDRGEELDMPMWDIYKDDDAFPDQIFDMS